MSCGFKGAPHLTQFLIGLFTKLTLTACQYSLSYNPLRQNFTSGGQYATMRVPSPVKSCSRHLGASLRESLPAQPVDATPPGVNLSSKGGVHVCTRDDGSFLPPSGPICGTVGKLGSRYRRSGGPLARVMWSFTSCWRAHWRHLGSRRDGNRPFSQSGTYTGRSCQPSRSSDFTPRNESRVIRANALHCVLPFAQGAFRCHP